MSALRSPFAIVPDRGTIQPPHPERFSGYRHQNRHPWPEGSFAIDLVAASP
jgi:hypothetical protein